ncbi:MAG: carbohydrate-binding family 9-like protein [Victivallaceae bacterium]
MKDLFLKTGFALAAIALLGAGCSTFDGKKGEKRTQIVAKYTAKPVTLDGTLNDKAWATAPAYQLEVSDTAYDNLPEKTRKIVGTKLREPGEFKLLWDKDYLYIGIKYTDSEVIAEGEKDQMHHYTLGDVAEVFIKPENETYYWELYVTPTRKKTAFFIPGRGTRISEDPKQIMDIKVAASVQGTLNNWQDKDQSWTGVMAIPIKGLEKYGAKFGQGQKWTVFVARYNYSRYLPVKELSAFPHQEKTNYHTLEDYGQLILEK